MQLMAVEVGEVVRLQQVVH